MSSYILYYIFVDECLTANAEVAFVLVSIPTSYDTVESEEPADEAMLNKV